METGLQPLVSVFVGSLDSLRGRDQSEDGRSPGTRPAHAPFSDGDLAERSHRGVESKQQKAHQFIANRCSCTISWILMGDEGARFDRSGHVQLTANSSRSPSVPWLCSTFMVRRSSAQGP